MKGSVSLLFMMVAATACSSAGGGPSSSSDPISWPAGEYVLEASVRYRQDSSFGTGSATERYIADLTITPSGSMTLDSSSGLCMDRLLNKVQGDAALGERTFECGNATFSLRPRGTSVGGEISVSVREEVRQRGPCIAYTTGANGQQVCTEYSWTVVSRMTTKRARLRVQGGP